MTHDRYTHRIISHVSDQRYQPRRQADLAQDLSIAPEEMEAFRASVRGLVEAGRIILGAADTIALPPPGRTVTGLFRLNQRGFGFILPDTPTMHGDLFVPPGDNLGAMTGDRVTARVFHQPSRSSDGKSPYIARITEIIQRAEKRYTGNLAKQGSHFVVIVDGKVLHQPVLVRDPHAKNAKLGDKVVIELLEYPTEDAPAEGVITEVLGEQGEPEVETLAVMRAYGLSDKFPEQVIEDAREAARSFDDRHVPAGRLDLTREFICTIDPPDAKDYDDAISIRRLTRGGDAAASGASPQRPPGTAIPPNAEWELGVHIADVSHFVRLGTALDNEARTRGNSVYLPRRVVPMLPELLSNGVCSLQEGVNRFCKTAFIYYDEHGRVVGEHFANTVIRSAKRMTYLEAQALIDGDLREAKRHAKTEPRFSSELTQALQLMNTLSRTIRERRLRDGMIVLGLPEVELLYDDSGRVVDAQPEDNAYTHTLIEMFMVEANEAVARLFNALDIPMIRRIHADPDAHDITELRQFARVAGFNIPARPSRKELQTLLDAVRGKPAQHAVHLAVLKTLSKAEYSPLLIGHFALASRHYTHFTSPIRRYPDLIVHRGLDAYFEAVRRDDAARPAPPRAAVASAMNNDPRCPGDQKLVELGSHCSATERNAQAAEGELRTYLVLDLLSNKLGEDFEGTITGATGAGVFVQIDRYLIDGFVKTADLPSPPGDRWRLNRLTGAMVAQRSGKTISIGDRFIVRIARVNPVSRQLDLVILKQIHGKAATPAPAPAAGDETEDIFKNLPKPGGAKPGQGKAGHDKPTRFNKPFKPGKPHKPQKNKGKRGDPNRFKKRKRRH